MTIQSYLSAIECFLPEATLSNEQINLEHPEWSADKISKKTGIYNRHIAASNEFSSDLGFNAAVKLFDNNPDMKAKVDYLIFCTQSPDYMIPTTACILQDRLGLSKNIGAIDINMGCSGYIYGLSYAKGIINSEQAKTVLLITAETYTKHIHSKDKKNKTIFGDGATASIISSESLGDFNGAIEKFSFYTDGSGFDKLILKNKGNRFENAQSEDIYDEKGEFVKNDDNLFMDGRAVFEFTSFKVPPLIQSVLTVNNINLEDIDLFIFHQANAFMMDFIRKRCKIPKDKFFVFLQDCGNTVSSTIPIALKEAIDQDRVPKGSKVLLVGFGVGLSAGSTLIKF
jgi:3-oxoacyl-[acyl-carrier-protein] synthase-3